MTPARFIETRISSWKRLEFLVGKAGKKGVRALAEGELHELTRLYPAIAVDVARARLHKTDATTQQKINDLAISSHSLLYRRKRSRSFRAISQFFKTDYPRLFRRHWIYLVLAAAVFFAGFSGAYISTRINPANAYLFIPASVDLTDGGQSVTAKDISERFRNMEKPPMAAGIITNNISVAFHAFALGITAGIGTLWILFENSLRLGGFAGHFVNHGLLFALLSFLIPHGLLEISAIIVSAAAGLRLGFSFAIPGNLKRTASLRQGARDAVLLVLGMVPMFIVAGMIEGFVTPAYVGGSAKIVVGVVVWSLAVCYLFLTARGEKPKTGDAS